MRDTARAQRVRAVLRGCSRHDRGTTQIAAIRVEAGIPTGAPLPAGGAHAARHGAVCVSEFREGALFRCGREPVMPA